MSYRKIMKNWEQLTVETKCERNLYKEAVLLWVSRKAEDGTQDLIVSQNIRNH